MNKQILVCALMVLMVAPYKSAFPQAVQDATRQFMLFDRYFPAALKWLRSGGGWSFWMGIK